jgi:pSer/pThr/pTyr-binding forkhead associated (FHA) protein
LPRIIYTDKSGRRESVFVGEVRPEVTVGRQVDCDIRTGEPSVSRYHCTIKLTNRGFELTDQGSSYGTFVNGVQIRQHVLHGGDEIRCGKFVLGFQEEDIDEDPGTMPVDVRPALASNPSVAAVDGLMAGLLSFTGLDGYDRTEAIDPSRSHIKIGRTDECDIQTTDGSVSRVHGEIAYRDTFFEYTDLGSANGSYVNDQPVTQFRLKSGDILRCGRFEIRFEETPYSAPTPSLEEHVSTLTQAAEAIARDSDSGPKETTLRPAPDRGEAEHLKRELERMRKKTDRLEKENATLESQVAELKKNVTEESEADSKLARTQVVIDSLRDRYDRLKAETDEQKADLDKFRVEARSARSRLEEMEYELSVAERRRKEAVERAEKLEGRLVDVSETSFDTKQAVEDAERNAHLAEFKLKRAQEDIERLQAMISGGDGGRMSEELAELRLAADERETNIQKYLREIDELREGLRRAELDRPAAAGAASDDELVDFVSGKVSQIRNELRSAKDYVADLAEAIEGLSQIDPALLPPDERDAVERVFKDLQPAVTLEDLQYVMNEVFDIAEAVREKIREERGD